MSAVQHIIKCRPVHMWWSNEEPDSNYIDSPLSDWSPYPSNDPNKIKFIHVYTDGSVRKPLRDPINNAYVYLIASVDREIWDSYPPQTPGIIDRTYYFNTKLDEAFNILREVPMYWSLLIGCYEEVPEPKQDA